MRVKERFPCALLCHRTSSLLGNSCFPSSRYPKSHGGFEKSHDNGVRIGGLCGQLGKEEGRYKERMRRTFDNSRVSFAVSAHDTKVAPNDLVAIAFIESVAAGEPLGGLVLPIGLKGQGIRCNIDLSFNTGE